MFVGLQERKVFTEFRNIKVQLVLFSIHSPFFSAPHWLIQLGYFVHFLTEVFVALELSLLLSHYNHGNQCILLDFMW